MPGVSRKELHPYFAELMELKGWRNSAEVARATGITQPTAYQMIHGGYIPSVETALKFSKAAGIPLESLIQYIERARTERKSLTA